MRQDKDEAISGGGVGGVGGGGWGLEHNKTQISKKEMGKSGSGVGWEGPTRDGDTDRKRFIPG